MCRFYSHHYTGRLHEMQGRGRLQMQTGGVQRKEEKCIKVVQAQRRLRVSAKTGQSPWGFRTYKCEAAATKQIW